VHPKKVHSGLWFAARIAVDTLLKELDPNSLQDPMSASHAGLM